MDARSFFVQSESYPFILHTNAIGLRHMEVVLLSMPVVFSCRESSIHKEKIYKIKILKSM